MNPAGPPERETAAPASVTDGADRTSPAGLDGLSSPTRVPRPRRYRVGGRGGRTSPPAAQESLFDVEVRSELRYYSQMLDALARSGFGSDTLAAELTVSKLFGTVWSGQSVPRDGSIEETFGLGLVDFARAHRSLTSVALLQTIAIVAPIREVRQAASQALLADGLPEPHWTDRPGAVVSGRCWAYEDVFGDQTIVLSEFAYGRDARVDDRHGIMLQIDHVAFSAAVNTVLVDLVDATVRELSHEAANSAGMFTVRQVDPAWARAIQARALARADLISGVPLWPRYADVRALALARLSVLAETADILPLDPEPPGPAGRTAIVREFLQSPSAAGLDVDYADAVARIILDHGCMHDPGNVIRVSPAKWDSFLFDWWPAREIAGPWPAVLAAWSEWAGEHLGLPRSARDELADALAETLESTTA